MGSPHSFYAYDFMRFDFNLTYYKEKSRLTTAIFPWY